MGTFFGKDVTRREVPTDRPNKSVGKVEPPDNPGKPEEEAVLARIPKGVCKNFLWGLCRRGNECKFTHPGARKAAPNLRPACLNFLNGKCKLNLWQCKYRHISEAEHEKEKAADRAQGWNH